MVNLEWRETRADAGSVWQSVSIIFVGMGVIDGQGKG